MIVDNTYRAGSTPIQLRSGGANRSPQANRRSILRYLTHDDSLALSLRPDGNRLIGETDLFTFRFEPTPGGRLLRDRPSEIPRAEP